MTHYEFKLAIVVDGRPRAAGEVVPAADIPAGCLASLVRLGQVVEVAAPPSANGPAAPKSPAKK